MFKLLSIICKSTTYERNWISLSNNFSNRGKKMYFIRYWEYLSSFHCLATYLSFITQMSLPNTYQKIISRSSFYVSDEHFTFDSTSGISIHKLKISQGNLQVAPQFASHGGERRNNNASEKQFPRKTATTLSIMNLPTQQRTRELWQEPNCGSGRSSSHTAYKN